ncbi:MAG: hypothetical protein ACQKBV_09280 [Puniceicoccales bacterium]
MKTLLSTVLLTLLTHYAAAYSVWDMISLGETYTRVFQPQQFVVPVGDLPTDPVTGFPDPSGYTPPGLPTEVIDLHEGDMYFMVNAKNTSTSVTAEGFTSDNINLDIIAGPAVVELTPDVSSIEANVDQNSGSVISYTFRYLKSAFTYGILVKTDASPEQGTSDPIVMPGLPGEQFQVILQESTNLVDWTTAIPGQKTASSTPVFYRAVLVPVGGR